jgi:bifunctional DNA primase/polymerase-like protein/FaeA-like protein
MQAPADLRLQLCKNGYDPLPLMGKAPVAKEWQKRVETSEGDIEIWSKVFPDAKNTGILTRLVPTLDLDIVDQDAIRTVEEFVRAKYEEHGLVLSRVGKPPKLAIPFRTDEPFSKIIVSLIAPNGTTHKIEFLASGQQVVADGVHPETGKPYRWHGGDLCNTRREELAYIREAEAHALVDAIVGELEREHGYKKAADRPRSNGNSRSTAGKAAIDDWQHLIENIRKGVEYHDSLRSLAAKLVCSGTSAGAAVNQLRAFMQGSEAPHDARWKLRYDDIPHLVETAEAKFREPEPNLANTPPRPIDETLAVFDRWLILHDKTPIYAVLGTVAANLLPGDPVWLGVIGPPSSAKTEILNSISMLPHVVQAATLTVAGLLSGTPKKQHDKGAKGGLLRRLGEFGIISLKDFGSILSMHTETRAEVMAALREIFDGSWTRHLGTDGGKTLAWKGKVGLVFGATGVIDGHYSVIGAMGDRFLFSRLEPAGKGQFRRALKHVGPLSKQMRKELAEAVAGLFAGRKADPQPISEEEIGRIDRVISLAVRLRGAVERDRFHRDIQAIYGAEGTARIGLALERLLAGLDILGVGRSKALEVVEAVALDSVPPARRAAYEYLRNSTATETTAKVAAALGVPSVTVRRTLEDLAAYGLVKRTSQGQGNPDLWSIVPEPQS